MNEFFKEIARREKDVRNRANNYYNQTSYNAAYMYGYADALRDIVELYLANNNDISKQILKTDNETGL